jgi:hypothetical protein
VLAVIGAAAAGGIGGAARIEAPAPIPFSVTRLQAEEVAAVVGFLHTYNRGDLKGALSFFAIARRQTLTAADCNYRRRATEVFVFRAGLVRWLRQRFADHDRLTLGRIHDDNPGQPIGVVGIEYGRRTSDTLRKLGFARGIVPQGGQKMPFRFVQGKVKLPFFGLASPSAPTPNPECALVPAPG